MTLTFRLSDVTGYAAIAELFGVLTFSKLVHGLNCYLEATTMFGKAGIREKGCRSRLFNTEDTSELTTDN
jgi:hypothetical protein